MSYLVRHNSTWHFRYRTGNICLKLSLDTGNLRRAKRMSQKLHLFMARNIEDAMTESELRRALAKYRDMLLSADQERRWTVYKPLANLPAKHLGQDETYDELLHDELKLAVNNKDSSFLSGLDGKFQKITGIDINVLPDTEKSMVRYLVAVELLKFMDIQKLRMQGLYSLESVITQSMNHTTTHNQPTESLPSMLMSEAIASWEAALREDQKRNSTLSKYLLCAREFQELNGNIDLRDITSTHCRNYRNVLKQLPAHYKQKFKDKSIADVIKMTHPANTLCNKVSINDKLNAMKLFMAWAVNEGHIEKNLMANIREKVAKRTRAIYGPYSREDIRNLFDLTYLSRTSGKAWKFWIPLLALFTGARQSELDQLKVNDVVQIEGIWCIRVQVDPDDANSSRKTDAGVRIIPLHPFLVTTLRFPEFALSQKSKDKRIFDSTVATSGYGKNVSKWYNQTFLPKVHLEEAAGKRKAFHSFRSTVCTVLKLAHADARMASQVIGHIPADVSQGWTEGISMTFDYYGDLFPARQLYKEIIMKIEFGVNLDHLTDSPWVPRTKSEANSNG